MSQTNSHVSSSRQAPISRATMAPAQKRADRPSISPEAIAVRAYEKFLQRSGAGAPGGEDEDWLAAEQELIVEAQSH
jgi:hypothetical protein